MEEIIVNATEKAAEVAAEQVVKAGRGKYVKGGIIVMATGAALYLGYKGVKWLRKKTTGKNNATGPVAAAEDFDNVEQAKRDFLDGEDTEE